MAAIDIDHYRRLVTDEAVDALLDGIKDASINKHRDEAYLRDGIAAALRVLHQNGVIEVADAGEVKTSPTPTDDECGLCLSPRATGYAKIGDVRYCHGDFDDSPTCYERAQRAPIDKDTRPVCSTCGSHVRHPLNPTTCSNSFHAPIDSAPTDHVTHRPGCGHWPGDVDV